MKFRKKPVVIEAWLFGEDTADAVSHLPGVVVLRAGPFHPTLPPGTLDCAEIKTLEGTMVANVGDWIIRGVKGEFYPCKPDIFEATYEAVNAQGGGA